MYDTLSVEDCFYIGKKSAEHHDHETAVNWLQGCASRFDSDTVLKAAEILISSALFVGESGDHSRNTSTNTMIALHLLFFILQTIKNCAEVL